MTRVWVTIGLLLASADISTHKPCPAPLWTADLVSKYHLEPFVVPKHPRNATPPVWQTQRGITFTSPERLVIYQVVESKNLTQLAPRDVSGGGGKFTLRALFLDARDGNGVHEATWSTSALDYSQVYATHDGRFLVRTGRMLRSYSPDFHEIASRSLPNNTGNLLDSVIVVPPGKVVFTEQEWFRGVYRPSRHEKNLIDADTLNDIPNPSPADVALWTDADDRFPELTGHRPRRLTFEEEVEESKHFHDCAASAFVGPPQRTYDPRACRQLNLFSSDGRPWWHLEFSNEAPYREINGHTLAVNLAHYRVDPFDLGLAPKPLQIVIYDLAQKTEKCSIDLTKMRSDETYNFAVSPDGLVAVRLGNKLSVYKP